MSDSLWVARKFSFEEVILDEHSRSEGFVRNMVVKPQNRLTDAHFVNSCLVVLIRNPNALQEPLRRFRDVFQHGIVEFVMDFDRNDTDECCAKLFGIWSVPMPSLIEQMMPVRTELLNATLMVSSSPSFLLRHNAHPHFSKILNVRSCLQPNHQLLNDSAKGRGWATARDNPTLVPTL